MGKLKAGVGKAIITPPVGYYMSAWTARNGRSIGVHDDMCAKALILDDGESVVALIALDVVSIPTETAQIIRSRIQELTGIPARNVLVNCSHTHTSPFIDHGVREKGYENYVALFPDYVAGTVVEAYHNTEEATLGVGKGRVLYTTCNRRHPELTPDPEVGVIRVDRRDGVTLATLVNFQCHGVAVGGQYLTWTADYPGFVERFVERACPRSTCLFIQGAGGNIHPWDLWFSNPKPEHGQTYEDAERLGNAVGSEACKVMQTVLMESDVEIKTLSKTITLPHRELWFTLEEAEKTLKDVMNRGWRYYEGDVWPKGMTIATIHLSDPGRGHYGLGYAKTLVRWVKEGLKDVSVELQIIKINDLILAANPGELFYQLGMMIKSRSPCKNTFVLGYSNGSIGYVPTKQAIEETQGMPLRDYVDPVVSRWAYGASTSTFSADAGEKLVKETLKLIKNCK